MADILLSSVTPSTQTGSIKAKMEGALALIKARVGSLPGGSHTIESLDISTTTYGSRSSTGSYAQTVSCLRRHGLVTTSRVVRGLGPAMVRLGGPTLDRSRHSKARRRGLPGTIAGNTAILRPGAGASCLVTTMGRVA